MKYRQTFSRPLAQQAAAVCLVGGVLLMNGCQSSTPGYDTSKNTVLIERMGDRELSVAARVRALDAWAALDQPVEDAWPVVARAVWTNRQPDPLRLRAIDHALMLDEERFVRACAAMLGEVRSEVVYQRLLNEIDERGWHQCLPALIQVWALRLQQPINDLKGESWPEQALIERLAGEPAERFLLRWIGGLGPGAAPDAAQTTLNAQVGGWLALLYWLGPETADARLRQASFAAGSLGERLQAFGEVFDVWPRTREQTVWLLLLERPPIRRSAGMAIRHAALAERGWPESARVGQSLRRLDGETVYERDADASKWRPQVQSARSLSTADQASVAFIRAVLDETSVLGALFAQAEADTRNVRGEHGGLLRFIAPDTLAVEAIAQPSQRAVHDERYVPPASLITDLPDTLALYHFHAQSWENAALAGPGKADLAFADAYGCHCLVITPIDRNRMNVDWFTEGGITVDLGMITRP